MIIEVGDVQAWGLTYFRLQSMALFGSYYILESNAGSPNEVYLQFFKKMGVTFRDESNDSN